MCKVFFVLSDERTEGMVYYDFLWLIFRSLAYIYLALDIVRPIDSYDRDMCRKWFWWNKIQNTTTNENDNKHVAF